MTFVRQIRLPAARLAGIAGIFLVVGSCAPAISGAAAPEPTASRGMILAMRPVLPGGAGVSVLNSLASSAPGTQAASGQPMDYIVREAGGGTISVVQMNELHLQVGDPVTIVRGDRTRLARPGG